MRAMGTYGRWGLARVAAGDGADTSVLGFSVGPAEFTQALGKPRALVPVPAPGERGLVSSGEPAPGRTRRIRNAAGEKGEGEKSVGSFSRTKCPRCGTRMVKI
jgi:hypothetical protein